MLQLLSTLLAPAAGIDQSGIFTNCTSLLKHSKNLALTKFGPKIAAPLSCENNPAIHLTLLLQA